MGEGELKEPSTRYKEDSETSLDGPRKDSYGLTYILCKTLCASGIEYHSWPIYELLVYLLE